MLSNGQIVGDGSWNLRVLVTDLQTERLIRVKGDLHIGGVMLRLVEDLEISMDWSDHALWWPERNTWLTRTRSTLDQCGVQADALLHFTPMHKSLRVQMPDLRYLDLKVDFSINTFSTVVQICKEIGLRHPEELSLCKPLEPHHLKYNYKDTMTKRKGNNHHQTNNHHHRETQRHGDGITSQNDQINHRNEMTHLPPDTNTFIATSSPDGSTGSLDKPSSAFLCAPVTPTHRSASTPIGTPVTNGTPGSGFYSSYQNHSASSGYLNGGGVVTSTMLNTSSSEHLNGGNPYEALAHSPDYISPDVRKRMVRPRSLLERARMNVAWLDSSLSIMEQGVREFDVLCLRFKFYVFYDLNPKYDSIRINQIYEQAKWQLLNEEIDCTEEEMLMFAALQLQIYLRNRNNYSFHSADESSHYRHNGNTSDDTHQLLNGSARGIHTDTNGYGTHSTSAATEDEIDAALTDLQTTLEGANLNSQLCNDITQVPELYDELRFLKPKRFTLRAYKRYWFTCRDLHLYLYKSREEMIHRVNAAYDINLRGCEVTPDVHIGQNKYGIKLEVASADGMTEMYIRCDDENQYAKWMACCRLAAKGRSLADSSYETEKQTILDFLHMQKPADSGPAINPNSLDIQMEDYVAPRFLKKLKGKTNRILEAHANVKDLSLVDAKMSYIKAWQSLPDYGITLFVIRFMGSKKEELLGVAQNRIMKMDINSGDHQKTWRYNTMKAWNVNWEVKHMMIQFEDGNIVFSCLSADCKVVHEFIGGYIFLSTRSKDASQTLNEELFHKLTGGWS